MTKRPYTPPAVISERPATQTDLALLSDLNVGSRSEGIPCDLCARPNCRHPGGTIEQAKSKRARAGIIACEAIAEVRALSRFDIRDRPYLARYVALTGFTDLTIRTMALMRAYRRVLRDRRLDLVERYAAADEIACEVAHYFAIDLDATFGRRERTDREIEDAIGDLCPACRKPMSEQDGPATKDDYRCAECVEKGDS